MRRHQLTHIRFIKHLFLIVIALSIGTLTSSSGRFKTHTSAPILKTQQSKKVAARLRFTLPGGKKKMPVHLIAFSPDGRVVANSRGGEEVKLWDVASGKLIATLTGDKRGIDGFSFSPDGRLAATRDLFDKKVRLWEVESGKLVSTLSGLKSRVDKMKAVQIKREVFAPIAFSPNGEMILTERNDDTVDVWEVSTGKLRATLEHDTQSSSIKDSLKAVLLPFGGTVPVLVLQEMFSPDGQAIATYNGDKSPKLWDAETGQLKATLAGHSDRVYALGFSKDGKLVFTLSSGMEVKLWDAETGQLRWTFGGGEDKLIGFALSPAGQIGVSTHPGKEPRLWDMTTGKVKVALPDRKATAAIFGPDGRTVVTARIGERHPVKLWDAETGELKVTLADQKDKVERIGFSPDGSVLVTILDKAVKLWNPSSGELMATLEGARFPVTFSPDGKTLAARGEDNATMLWELFEQ